MRAPMAPGSRMALAAFTIPVSRAPAVLLQHTQLGANTRHDLTPTWLTRHESPGPTRLSAANGPRRSPLRCLGRPPPCSSPDKRAVNRPISPAEESDMTHPVEKK